MIFYTFLNENSDHNEEHNAAHMLLEYGLKKLYGISGSGLEKGEHGKPYLPGLPGIHFSLSHCRGLAVCGISECEIGVDAELIRNYSPKAMKRIFSPEEHEMVLSSEDPNEKFFRIWTLKEALGKYFGTGLFSNLSSYSFSLDDEQPSCENAGEKIFTQKILQKKWIVSICAHDPENDFVFISNQ